MHNIPFKMQLDDLGMSTLIVPKGYAAVTADIQVMSPLHWRSIQCKLILRHTIIIKGKVNRDDGELALQRQGTFSFSKYNPEQENGPKSDPFFLSLYEILGVVLFIYPDAQTCKFLVQHRIPMPFAI